MDEFCFCGRRILIRMGIKMCSKHGTEIKKPEEKVKQGHYPGKSKTPFGSYEER